MAQSDIDTAKAKSRQNGGGISGQSFFEREVAAGLRDTTTGRDQFYENKSRISTPDPTDWGIHDDNPVTPSAQGGRQEDVVAGGGGDGSTPLYQDGAYTGPFAIKINGSYSTDGEGQTTQSPSFTISVEGGSGTWPTKTQTFSGNGGVSASASDEFYRIYGKITATRTAGSKTIDSWSNPSVEVVTATSGETIGSNTRFKNEGSNTYTFFFLIGTVGITVQPTGGYKIFVNQVQIGDYTYGTAQGVEADADGNDTRDGLKSLTICINGTPYTADFEITNIVKV
jgi:hypothetical protein